MRGLPRAATFAVGAVMLAFGACSSRGTPRVVVLHALDSCIPDAPTSDAGDAAVFVSFAPGGDFAPAPAATIPVGTAGIALPFRAGTQMLAAQVGAAPPSFLGLGAVPPSGDVNLLLWSSVKACRATQSAVAVAGETMGLVDANHLLLVPGQDSAFLFDLTTGTNTPLPQALNLLNATITPFGGKALIAGGEDVSSTPFAVLPTTTVFTPDPGGASGTFAPGPGLQRARTSAGALVLPGGATLLVGGVSSLPVATMSDGGTTTEPPGLTPTMETVDPTTGMSTVTLAALAQARSSPTVMRLTNGQIAVAGGQNALGLPVTTIEWFDAALTTPLCNLNLLSLANLDAGVPETATQYLFAPLEGGAILTVIAGLQTNNVFVVHACNAAQPGSQPSFDLAPPLGFPLNGVNGPALFPAARAAPVLWTGTTWARWQPWSGQFEQLGPNGTPIPSDQGPAPALTGANLPLLATDPGLATWVAADTSFSGLRYDTRNPYVIDTYFDATNTAPDRLVESGGTSTFNWDQSSTGGLTISGDVKAFVTDATYANLTLTATILTGTSVTPFPGIILRGENGCEYEIGAPTTCPNPTVPPTPCGQLPPTLGDATISVVRQGTSATWSVVGASSSTVACNPGFGPGERVSVGFHGQMPGAVLSGLSIVRSP